tara:strand:+ start:57 stop:902 length:846 start_codon:yes stop_codon:yes gene_type:complete
MSKVSVIIPCYNSGKTILRAVQSVQVQTYKNIEIIIVNDGSTDKYTLDIFDNLSEHVKIINQENRGLPSARNTGITKSSGKYILPLDSDDYLLPNFVEKALKKIENEKGTHVVFSNLYMFGDREGILIRNFNFFAQLFTNQLPYCLFFEKKIWSDIGGYDENMKIGYEDWEFNIRLSKNGYYPSKIDEALFYYSVSSKGMLKSQSDKSYISILRYIRSKHNDIYNIFSLYKIWNTWSEYSKPYPTLFYILMFIGTECIPGNIFNYIYSKLSFLKQSERLSE